MIKVSVIVPVYNVERYLRRCLNSLVNQTLEEIEIIIVNDGTKDNSESIILEFVEKFPSKIIYLTKENGGLSDARNFGIPHATGEYIAFLDSDDYVEKDIYEKLYNEANKSKIKKNIIECNFFWSYDEKQVIDRIVKYDSIQDYIINGRVVAWNKLYRSKWLKNINIEFPKGLLYEDLEYFMKLVCNLSNIEEVSVVDEPLIHYIQREDAISYSESERVAHIVKIYENVFDYYKKHRKFDMYKYELEYKFCRNLLGSFMIKVLRIKDKKIKKDLLNLFWEKINGYFPLWRSNPYIKKNYSCKNLFIKFIPGFIYKNLYRL